MRPDRPDRERVGRAERGERGARSSSFDESSLPSFTVQDAPEVLPTSGTVQVAPQIVDSASRHEGTGLVRHDVALLESKIDSDAAKVVRRLERSGFQAYLVGGCVRDLLLDGRPKDYDIATSARPEDVRSLFRNSRIIGRRFRLVHVLFGQGKMVEVATFRRSPQVEAPEDDGTGNDASDGVGDDLLIRSDNVFGEAHEDALRRDFTINALFYDLDRRQVLDWCGGMGDIERRTIHTIGDPTVRFREDPVRILRAVKFAARLDLGISPEVYDAMVMNREELAKAARPRLSEEILRLMRGGASHRSMWLLWEVGAMGILLPELSTFLDDDEATAGGGARFWRRMDALDKRIKEGPLDDLVLWTSLLYEPMAEALAGQSDPLGALGDFLEPIVLRIAMPRRIADGIRRIVSILPKLVQGKLTRVGRTDVAMQALDVLEIDYRVRKRPLERIAELRRELAAMGAMAQQAPAPSNGEGGNGHGNGQGSSDRPRRRRPPRRF